MNGPASVVVSGDPDTLDTLFESLAAEDVRVRRIAVDYASHSAHVDLLRDELLHSEYHRQDVLQRILDWIWRRLQGGVGAASGSSWISTLVIMLVAVLLLVGLALLVSQIRRDRRRRWHR